MSDGWHNGALYLEAPIVGAEGVRLILLKEWQENPTRYNPSEGWNAGMPRPGWGPECGSTCLGGSG